MHISRTKHVHLGSAGDVGVKNAVLVFMVSNVGLCKITIHGEAVRGPLRVVLSPTVILLIKIFTVGDDGTKAIHRNLVVSVVVLKLFTNELESPIVIILIFPFCFFSKVYVVERILF